MNELGSPNTPFLSVVVPVYREPECIFPFISRLNSVLSGEKLESYEIVFSVDPSDDDTYLMIESASHEDDRIRALLFSRRVGQPMATIAGLEHSRGAIVIVMDVDLQDPPELIPAMIKKWEQGFRVVYAKRRSRDGETLMKKVIAKAGYTVIGRFGNIPIPRDTGDFRLLDRRVVDELGRFNESHGFLRGLVALVGFSQTAIEFDRPARHSGRGSYNRYLGSLKIGFDGVVGFSSALLNLSTVFGLITATSSFLLGTAYATLTVFGFPFPIGNPTIVTLVLFVGGVQLICIGIMGQYIGRIYDEVKRRPRYIIDQRIR